MYILKNKKFDVKEYSPKIVKGLKKVNASKAPSHSYSPYKINLLRLAIAIAKCTFTKGPDRNYRIAETIINIVRVTTLVFKTSDERFLLNKQRLELIRDFSKTTRIGEIAQGVSFLFAQDVLRIPTPHDFSGFCETNYGEIPKGSTPDFIGSHKDGTYDLIESKGTQDPNKKIISGRLNAALKQCDKGEVFLKSLKSPNAHRKFGILTVLEKNNSTFPNNSSIHFIDPVDNQQERFNSWQLIVSYYKAIIMGFTGFDSISNFKEISTTTINIQNTSYHIFNINIDEFESEFLPFYIYPNLLSFGVSSKVLDILTLKGDNSEIYFQYINQFLEVQRIDLISNENSKYEIFSDGTIIKIN